MNKAVELRAIAAEAAFRAEDWLPRNLGSLVNHQTALPRIAKNKTLTQRNFWHSVSVGPVLLRSGPTGKHRTLGGVQ